MQGYQFLCQLLREISTIMPQDVPKSLIILPYLLHCLLSLTFTNLSFKDLLKTHLISWYLTKII